jgi:tRNA(Arg) A34 adenosine deaminase TadA
MLDVAGISSPLAWNAPPVPHQPSSPDFSEHDIAFMREAIRQMRRAGIVERSGGPFGAVIVRDGVIIAVAGNSVIKDCDPTAHAEINAIREACRRLNSVNLAGTILYTSCECCPMCYAAAYWARISKIYYAASWKDYDDLFDDATINHDIAQPYPRRMLSPQQLLQDEALKVWNEFRQIPGGARY